MTNINVCEFNTTPGCPEWVLILIKLSNTFNAGKLLLFCANAVGENENITNIFKLTAPLFMPLNVADNIFYKPENMCSEYKSVIKTRQVD